MRIVSGKYRGRRLQPPVSLPVRPTTDFAKEGLFNILAHRTVLEDITVLDLFAGTGSISFEFLSRGASTVTSVDANQRCIDFIKKTALVLADTNIKPVRSDCFSFLKHTMARYNLIFADPPYDMEGIDSIPDLIFSLGILEDEGILILEHSSGHRFDGHSDYLDHRNYGSVNFTFFRRMGE